MIFKVAPIFVLVTVACGVAINVNQYDDETDSQNYYQYEKQNSAEKQYARPAENHKYEEQLEEKYESAYPKYEFKYAVSDDAAGDQKSQHEVRDGDQVKGVYTLMDSDGFQRIVEYTANDKDGFVAVVRREPIQGFKSNQQQYENHAAQQQPQYESYTAKQQQQQQPQQQQQYESYTSKQQPQQQQHYESYAAKKQQPNEQRYAYKPAAETHKYTQVDSYENPSLADGKYFIKYSTAAPEVKYVTSTEAKYVYTTDAPETKYHHVAPVSEGTKYVAPSVAKANLNHQTVGVSHVNNYFESPKTEEYNTNSAPGEYNYGYDY